MAIHFPQLSLLPLARYAQFLAPDRLQRALAAVDELRLRFEGHAVWNVSSSAVGGGVAEMVRSLLAYARGAGIDARWVVIDGPPEFFRITKRLHNALHDSTGDGSPLGTHEHALYRRVVEANGLELLPLVRPGDFVIVHDPQPAALIADAVARGAHVIWRCHIGHDVQTPEVRLGWDFLAPYVRPAAAYVFSRAAYVPPQLDRARAVVIPPSIDPCSAKNQPLSEAACRAILVQSRLVDGPRDPDAAVFSLEDGSPGRVDRAAEVLDECARPTLDTPLIVQVSRWDRLKDPIGVLHGFARLDGFADAHLVLAGPSLGSVADDPEGLAVFQETFDAWRALPPAIRTRAHLASLPSADVDENAAIVNALQRHARIIVQKSLFEGFGLTVTEGMWKARPVVASAVGGIRDQIDDGVQGLLLDDPRDPDALARALGRILGDPGLGVRLGAAGHQRVLERYLGLDSLLRFGALLGQIGAHASPPASVVASPDPL